MAADRWGLVGRTAACEAIRSTLDARPPSSLVLAGPAGVGRTRMAREALRAAEASGRPTSWAAATGAAVLVPLGALAHLLPAVDASSDALVLLQRTLQSIAGNGTGPPPVLGIDDMHLLDPLSVTLLHQLAASGAVSLVLTVRTGSAAPDPSAPLWKDGLATRIELPPLDGAETEQLISHALGGDVDTRTGERLWRLSRGSPLFLRELLDDGLVTGRLRNSAGLWRWDGPMLPPQRLAEIVLGHLGDVDAAERNALEVLAVAEPLSVRQVVSLSSPDAVAALERRGLIGVDRAGGAGRLRIAHPMYADVVRCRASQAALRMIRQQLADGPADLGSSEHLVRRCAALLDGDVSGLDAGLLTDAARRALAMPDLRLAERLARAGIEAGGGVAAHLVLVEAARWQGQPARAEELARAAASVAATDDEAAEVAATRAITLVCGHAPAGDAGTVLRGAAPVGRDARAVLAAAEGIVAFLGGDPRRAVQQATAALSAASGGPVPDAAAAQPLAAAAAAAALTVTGRTDRALATVEAGRQALRSLPGGPELLLARVALAHAEVMALLLAGRIAELERRTEELHRRNLAGPEWPGDAVACLHRGWAALAAGRRRVAIRWLVEALAGMERADPAGMIGLCRCLLAAARALIGDTPGASQVLGQQERDLHPVFGPWAGFARACLAAAEGRPGAAGDLVMDAAALAAEQGQPAVEALLLHAALRLHRRAEVVQPLRQLARTLHSPLVADLAAHAEAVVAGDAERLDLLSRRFHEAGALLFAADAAADAAQCYDRTGSQRRAAASRARAFALVRECGLTATPTLHLPAPPVLTSREEEVARLASRGLSNQEIADRLVVSVRTVEAHLSHIYTKVGISSRNELAATLTAAPATPAGRAARAG